MAGHQAPESVAEALRILQQAGLLIGAGAQDNRDAVVGGHYDPMIVAYALSMLQTTGLLTG